MNDTRAAVIALRRSGVPYRAIASRFGISESHARKCGSPGTSYESSLRASREAKRRRGGKCIDCGRRTRYDGHEGREGARRCPSCAHRKQGIERLKRGVFIEAVIQLLEAGGDVTFSEMRDLVVSLGGHPRSIHSILYQRLVPRGLAVRVSRGVYVAGSALRQELAA